MDPASTWLLQVVVAAAAALLLPLLWVVRERVVGRAGGLPPGRLGLPLLGETLQLVSAYKTEQPEPFVDERVRGGHRVFTTHLFGEATVFSADPEVNRQVLLGEGRLFESSYPTSISTLLGRRSVLLMRGALHRRMHALLSSTIASPTVIRHFLLPDIDRLVRRTLDSWEDDDHHHPAPSSGSTGRRVLLQDQAKKITFELTVKQLMSVEPGEWTEGLRREYLRLIEGFFSIPIPFSFTTYGRALQARTKVAEAVRSVVRERKREMGIRKSSDEISTTGCPSSSSSSSSSSGQTTRKRDLLGALLEAETEEGAPEFPDEEEAVDFLLALLVAGYETTSTIITLAVKYLTDHPRALALLREEHEGIRKRKDAEPAGDFLDWADYKSMTFTHCVINETLRVANIISGVFRRAVADVPIKGGYSIPKGCKVFASFRAVHMDPAYYSEARTFNPWRWCSQSQSQSQSQQKKKQPQEASVFCPFGGGPRLCPGNELARVEISVFLHYLVTRFTWEVAEDDRVVFFPTTRTIKGYPINVRTRRLATTPHSLSTSTRHATHPPALDTYGC